jgi:hypothetical protein
MQITVGLRWKSGYHLFRLTLFEVCSDGGAQEIAGAVGLDV